MTNYYIYARDFSFSTDGFDYYHDNGLKTLEQFKIDVEKMQTKLKSKADPIKKSKIIYLHWGKYCEAVNEKKTRIAYHRRLGNSPATNPSSIVHWLKNFGIGSNNNKIRILYIITDGLINRQKVEECFETNKDMHYETVVFHALNEKPNEIDLSVASSFFKKQCIIYRNNKLQCSVNISQEHDYDKINLENFASEIKKLFSYIKIKFLKEFKQDATALNEIDKLKKLRKRLFNDLAMKMCEQERHKPNVNLETKDKNVFLREFVRTEWYKSLVATIDSMNAVPTKADIEKSISTLINYIVSESKSYSFDELKVEMTFNKVDEVEPIVDVNFVEEQEVEFPDIILDDDKGIPVIILTKLNLFSKIIFHGKAYSLEVQPASFNKFITTMECPLFLVNDKDISESIGYFYTFSVYKQFLENNINAEPRNRRPFKGGIVLTDTDQFDKYNDYILSATYFDSKKVKFNVGLFYYVLWKNCENKEWMDINVVDRFKKYAMRRISETVCKIGLSSLPLDPQEYTWLTTALWYCVELSSCIFKDDPQHFVHERLRMFYGVTHCMIEILKYFNYDLDLKAIERRRDLVSQVMILKKIQGSKEKKYYLLKNIFKTVDGFLVSEIEKPFNLYKLNYVKLDHKKILPDNIVDEIVHLNDYVHLMHFVGDLEASKASKNTVAICEKTFRPYFAIDSSKSFYTELVQISKKVVISNDDDKDNIRVSFEPIDSLQFDRILSLYNLFMRCVQDLKEYPTLPQYVEYIKKKKQFHGDVVTIFPPTVYFDIKDVYNRYQKIVAEIEATEFIEICKINASRTNRIKAEERVKFNSDDEINEFVRNEEQKVNLKKNAK